VFGHRIVGSVILARLLIGMLAVYPCLASADDLDFYSARILSVSRELSITIRPTLDAHAQDVLDDIVFEAPTSWVTNADARRVFPGRRVVEFNAGFLAVTDWLSQAMIADWAGHDGCLKEYSNYLAEVVGHNSRRAFKGRERKDVYDFAGYAANKHGQCEGALTNNLDSGRQQELREEILDAVIATVLLHEIAHHVLNHVSSDDNNIMQRRMRELAADRWAFNTAVNANYELRTAVPLFLFLAATGGGTLEDEIRSTHPSGLHRVRDLLVQTRTLLDAKESNNAHMLDASIDDLNRILR
jgi:predicted Zn-dependent protease with MMP-like domain